MYLWVYVLSWYTEENNEFVIQLYNRLIASQLRFSNTQWHNGYITGAFLYHEYIKYSTNAAPAQTVEYT